MLAKVGVAVLVFWFLGVAGVYHFGDLIHVFLLIGLLLLLVALLQGRDAAVQRMAAASETRSDERGIAGESTSADRDAKPAQRRPRSR